MRNSVIVFFASAIGGLVSAWLIAWSDRRYQVPGASFVGDPTVSFPAAAALKAGAVALVAAWLSVLLVIASVVLSSLLSIRLLVLLAVPVGLLAGFLGVFIWAAVRVRCPKCNRRVLDQPSQPPFPQEFFGLGGSAATVLKIVANGVFRCVHCGQPFTTKRSATV
jgi:hypothetical protein